MRTTRGDRRAPRTAGGKAALVLVVAVALVTAPVAFTGAGTGAAASAATFEVSNLQTPTEMVGSEPVTVTATVTNTGDAAATKTIEFRLYPYDDRREYTILASDEVQLAPGESTTVTLTSFIGGASGGSYDIGVLSPDDGVTTTIDILAAADFRLSELETQDIALSGATANASVTVTNVGEVTATHPVELIFAGGESVLVRQNVTLGPGESKRIDVTAPEVSLGLFGSAPNVSRAEQFGFVVTDELNREYLLGGLKLIPGEQTIRIEGTGQYTTYEIRTTYGVAGKNRLESGDVVGETTINGAVVGGVDAYTVTGNILQIQVNGPDDAVRVYKDGREISLNPYGDEDTVTFVGDGNASTYAFTASRVTGGDGLGPADSFTERGGSGFVSGGSDAYTFAGVLKSVSLSPGSDVRVLVDGQEIDPYDLGRSTTITFVGNGTTATYAFTTSNDIVDRRRLEARTDGVESFRGATGVVRGGIDEFVYTGELERLDVPPGVAVYIDGEAVDPDTVGDDP